MTLTVVSLFAGVGGFDLAFQRAGANVVAAVEIDKPARSVLARHFPKTALFDDVTKVTGNDLRAVGFVPERGIITGGFPCQDLSVAGRRVGLAGARSGLFWHIVRLLDELRPAWCLLENVPGLLSSNGGRDMGAVVGALGELGYGFAYRVLDAKFFGVPQQRRRVFIVGHLGAPVGAAAQVLFEPESGEWDSAAGRSAGPGVATAAAESSDRSGEQRLDTHTHTHNDFAGRREARLPDRRRIGGREPSHRREVVSALTTSYCGGSGGVDDNAAQAGYVIEQPMTISGGVTHALTSEGSDASEDGTGRGTISDATVVRRLTPLECERLQGFPDGWSDEQSDAQRYRQMGNAVAVPVVEWIARWLIAVDQVIS